jgi:hypothetical protein
LIVLFFYINQIHVQKQFNAILSYSSVCRLKIKYHIHKTDTYKAQPRLKPATATEFLFYVVKFKAVQTKDIM